MVNEKFKGFQHPHEKNYPAENWNKMHSKKTQPDIFPLNAVSNYIKEKSEAINKAPKFYTIVLKLAFTSEDRYIRCFSHNAEGHKSWVLVSRQESFFSFPS